MTKRKPKLIDTGKLMGSIKLKGPRGRGRPKLMNNPINRSVVLDEKEWKKMEKKVGGASWGARVRALLDLV